MTIRHGSECDSLAGRLGRQSGRWVQRRTAGVVAALLVFQTVPVLGQVSYKVFSPGVEPSRDQPGGQQPNPIVSLTVRDSSAEYVLQEIARQAHMRLFYDSRSPVLARRISVHVVKTPVSEALVSAFTGTGIVARVAPDGETIMVRVRDGDAAQRRQVVLGTIIGRVTDSATGAGLNGAQVRVEGTKLTAVTADSGHFALRNVPAGDQVLTVRLFGYRPVNRTITVVDGERTTVRIAMASVPTVLSGIVTTATGVRRRVELGNDITTINVDSVMRVAPISSVTDLLETRVPGLTVLHTSGEPGNPSRVRLRGASSITGNNDPIIIVNGVRVYSSQSDTRNQNLAPSRNLSYSTGTSNGVGRYAAPSPLDQIDPNNIETIEVFKGPSATSQYGSDAANGVIVITTKQGRVGPAHWTTTLGAGTNWVPGNWPTNYYKFGLGVLNQRTGSPFCLWNDVTCERDSLVAFQALNDPRYTVFAHGSDRTADLTVSGGVPTLQYSLTGSAASDVGNLKLPGIEVQRYEKFYGPIPGWMRRPDNYQTWGLGGQLTAQPTPQVKVTLHSNLFNSQQQQGSLQQAIGQLAGEYIDASQLSSATLIQNDVERATAEQVTSTNALTLSWQPYPWLPLSATGGLNTIQRNDATYIPYGVNSCAEGGLPAVGQPSGSQCNGDTTGSYGLGRGTSQSKTLDVSTKFPVLRLLTLGVGGNLYSQSTADVSAFTNQLAPGVSVPTTFPTENNASSFSQATSASATYGWWVEPQLNIHSRFFVTPGFRLDGGSTPGTNAGLTGFPKLEFSWIAVDRSQPRGILTMLHPRVAFGYAGTQPLPTQKLRLLGNTSGGGTGGVVSLDGTTFVPAIQVTSLGNTRLRPERSRELEGGADAELWNGRLAVTYSRANKTRIDAIVSVPAAPSVNANSFSPRYNYYTNLGVIRNTSTELTFTAQVLESRTLSWMVGGNLSNINNLVVRLNPGQLPVVSSNTRIQPGYPLWGVWARPIIAFADVNQNGIIDPSEIQYGDSAVFVGQSDPKYQLNLNTGVTMLNGRLSVNATFAYQNGLTQTNEGLLTSGGFAVLPNTPGTSLGTQAAVVAATCPAIIGGACFGFPVTSIGVMQTVNTFRFNELSINYNVPQALSTLLHVPRLEIALQGKNLGLHTNYRGKDPNVNVFSTNQVDGVSGQSYGDQTADAGQLPAPRTWWLKFTLGN